MCPGPLWKLNCVNYWSHPFQNFEKHDHYSYDSILFAYINMVCSAKAILLNQVKKCLSLPHPKPLSMQQVVSGNSQVFNTSTKAIYNEHLWPCVENFFA
jgi:hypothetical protein